jgi:hypothetical protein
LDRTGHQPQDSDEERVVPETPDASSSSNPSSVPWFESKLMAPPTVKIVTRKVGDDDDDAAAHPDNSRLEHFADLSLSRLKSEPALRHSEPLQAANGGTQIVKLPAPLQKQKAKKGAPSFPSKTPNERDPRTDHGTQRIPSEGHSKLDKTVDPYFNPLERSVPPRPSTTHVDLGIKRVSNYQDIFDDNQHRSVETLTEEEIEQKVAQIKSRPSRKSHFGKDQKLAHKRRHNLADIHDESDGAWKPLAPKGDEHGTGKGENVPIEGKDARTLKEVFDLPTNAIPMNNGDSELSFRDGTLVC